MLTFQLNDVLKDKLPDFQFYNIYLVRENDVIFYIGKAADAPERIKQHFGLSSSFNSFSSFADLILKNNPKSKRWKVNFYTIDDCRKIVGTKHLPRYNHKNAQWPPPFPCESYTKTKWREFNETAHDCRLLDDAEIAMIRHFRPCFNKTYNEYPSALPEKYMKQQHEAAAARRAKWSLGYGDNL